MANTQALATSFKVDLLNGKHAFGVPPVRATAVVDAFKMALYLASGSIGAATSAYSATSEVSGTNYTAGGVAVPNASAPAASGTTGCWTPSGSVALPNVTLASPFDCALMYNSSQGNAAVGSWTFGSQTVTAANFSLTMPANDAANALIRIA